MHSARTVTSPPGLRGGQLPKGALPTHARAWSVAADHANEQDQASSLPMAGRDFEESKAHALRVLVVDDNQDAADTLSELLGAMGYDVTTVYHPVSALERASQQAFDAFILDIGLPDLDGHALARKLRDTAHGQRAVFIAVTGYGSGDARQRSLAAGFDHHFTKPAQVRALLDALGAPLTS